MGDMYQDFSGGEPFESLPQPSSTAPALPIAGHIVAAALAAEKMRDAPVCTFTALTWDPKACAT